MSALETETKQTISYPQGFPQILKMSNQEFVEELRFLAAAKLYELGRLSAGKAAQLANMSRLDFIYELGEIGVAVINLDEEELDAEIKTALALAKKLSKSENTDNETKAGTDTK